MKQHDLANDTFNATKVNGTGAQGHALHKCQKGTIKVQQGHQLDQHIADKRLLRKTV